MTSLSVIVPTLNEAASIGELVASLVEQQEVELEVIVTDGGSSDDTVEIATASGALVVESEPGRGCQMNTGAASARGDYLLFLHADSVLTHSHQLATAVTCLKKQAQLTPTAGHFSLTFNSDNPRTKRVLAFFEAKTRLNRPGTFNGDQGLLVSANDFRLMQGFSSDLPFLEDQEFGDRFNTYGQFITLPGHLVTSARRFDEEGVNERIVLNTLIMGMYHINADSFFNDAPGAYRASDLSSRLDLRPFFTLVERAVFEEGLLVAVSRVYAIGRFATRNLWQVFLWWGLNNNSIDEQLSRHDKFVGPVVRNPLGYLVGAVTVAAWFYAVKYRLRRRSN